jgi:hypothetical protein
MAEQQRHQPRERASGQFGFEGDWGRICVCGHELGVHTAEAPHECMNNDRRHLASANDDWFRKDIAATNCDCMRFRTSRKRSARAQPEKR